MPNVPQVSVENNFVGGLKTEFTGLNFPENACTTASNTVFSIIGEADRREGFDFEPNYRLNNTTSVLGTAGSLAISTYKWNNAGGDGQSQIVVQQTGDTLYFYLSTAATTSSPLSKQILAGSISISQFLATNAVAAFDPTIECTYADGNGYLFVFNFQCDPFYCTYNLNTQTVTATVITVQIRDFIGIPEPGVAFNNRPSILTNEHFYNLINQGWSSWTATSTTTNTIASSGTISFTISSSTLPIAIGQTVTANLPIVGTGPNSLAGYITGIVQSYVGNMLTITANASGGSGTFSSWNITYGTFAQNYIEQFYILAKTGTSGGTGGTTLNVYPSNAEQWWEYRNTSVTSSSPDGVFKPQLTTDYVVLNNNQAPQGSIIFPAFIQDRTVASGVAGLAPQNTTVRPSNGAWFQGRVFFTGVNANFQQTTNTDGSIMPFYTWTENIYFSQIVQTSADFGNCYQTNDPTSSTLFDLLPDDGGVITIPGCGAVYKLFPISNGMFVFAANGVWFIGSSGGLGFTANDYTISKISGVQSIGYHSYINVLGWPVFWNEEGIYEVKPGQENVPYGHGGFTVNNLALGTILTFYNNIPLQSKKYARGDYDPVSYTIQWLYRSTNETSISNRYQFDSALTINTYKGPFYPYSFTASSGIPYICSMVYVAGPGGSNTPESQYEYLVCYNNQYTFAQERDNVNWQDWNSTGTLTNYISTFTTGYKLHGQAYRLWQPGYVYIYSDNTVNTAYQIQGLWEYGTSGTSGKWSTRQVINNNIPNFGTVYRRIKIRGHGIALQLKFTSQTGLPFNFMGWAIWENINQSV